MLHGLALVFLLAQAQAQPRLPDDIDLSADVTYCRVGERELKLDVVRLKTTAPAPLPALVHIHGGAFRAGNKASGRLPLVPFVRDGYVGFTLSYRLSGEALWPAQIHDLKCAIRYIRANAAQYGVDPARIAVWGPSAGGHLSAMLGTSGDVAALEGHDEWRTVSSRVQAVIDHYGPTNFLAMDRGVRPSCKNPMWHADAKSPESQLLGAAIASVPDKVREADPITYVSKDDPPFLIQHGDSDCLVPMLQSQLLQFALQGERVPVTLHILIGAGHGGPRFETPANIEAMKTFLRGALRGRPAK